MEVVELAVDEESMVNVSLALESALGEPDTDPPPPDSVLCVWSKKIRQAVEYRWIHCTNSIFRISFKRGQMPTCISKLANGGWGEDYKLSPPFSNKIVLHVCIMQ